MKQMIMLLSDGSIHMGDPHLPIRKLGKFTVYDDGKLISEELIAHRHNCYVIKMKALQQETKAVLWENEPQERRDAIIACEQKTCLPTGIMYEDVPVPWTGEMFIYHREKQYWKILQPHEYTTDIPLEKIVS